MTTEKKLKEKRKTKKQQGFTIIEIALVLAVAALIFLVVFLAVPALQRNQKNNAIRRDAAMIVAAVKQYYASNNGWGSMYSTGNSLTYVYNTANNNNSRDSGIGKYLDKLSSNTEYIYYSSGSTHPSSGDPVGQIYIDRGSRCGPKPSNYETRTGDNRQAAVVAYLAISGKKMARYCLNAI